MVKKSACNGEDQGSLLGSRRAPGVGNDGPFQYFCLENSMDKGARQATVYVIQRVSPSGQGRPKPSFEGLPTD